MRRRDFLALLGGTAAVWPRAADAQQSVRTKIGYIGTGVREQLQPELRSFHQGLSEAGYFEGRNLDVEYRWSQGRYEQLREMATDLTSRQVSLIVSTGVPATLAVQAATSSIPVVFVMGPDPIQFKLVASLNRPGGNITGATLFTSELAPKRLELLHDLLPAMSTIACLVNPKNARSQADIAELEVAAGKLRWTLVALKAGNDGELDEAFEEARRHRAQALIVGADPYFHGRAERLVTLASRHRIPAIFSRREYVVAGGLIGYGTRLTDTYRQGGLYAGRVLKGEKPADLPVLQPTTFELIINLKAARALGLAVPATLLARADEVIE